MIIAYATFCYLRLFRRQYADEEAGLHQKWICIPNHFDTDFLIALFPFTVVLDFHLCPGTWRNRLIWIVQSGAFTRGSVLNHIIRITCIREKETGALLLSFPDCTERSEERRVGKEGSSRWT